MQVGLAPLIDNFCHRSWIRRGLQWPKLMGPNGFGLRLRSGLSTAKPFIGIPSAPRSDFSGLLISTGSISTGSHWRRPAHPHSATRSSPPRKPARSIAKGIERTASGSRVRPPHRPGLAVRVCAEFRELLESWGGVLSMARRGDCWDGAVAESFWSTLKAVTTAGCTHCLQLVSREIGARGSAPKCSIPILALPLLLQPGTHQNDRLPRRR